MILEDAKIEEERRRFNVKESIQMSGEPKLGDRVGMNRKYKAAGLPPQQANRVQAYREKYEQFLKIHNNTSQKEVWKIYDHIAAELLKEQLNTVLQDVATRELDRFVEQVILDEFQV